MKRYRYNNYYIAIAIILHVTVAQTSILMLKNIQIDVKLISGIELAVPMTLLLGKYAS